MLREGLVQTLIESHVLIETAEADDLPPALGREAPRITREAVAHIVRQARADQVWITPEATDREARLRIANNGVGFEPILSVAADSDSDGLRTLRERVAGLGGTLIVQSTPGQGTTISVRVPIVPEDWEGKEIRA